MLTKKLVTTGWKACNIVVTFGVPVCNLLSWRNCALIGNPSGLKRPAVFVHK